MGNHRLGMWSRDSTRMGWTPCKRYQLLPLRVLFPPHYQRIALAR